MIGGLSEAYAGKVFGKNVFIFKKVSLLSVNKKWKILTIVSVKTYFIIDSKKVNYCFEIYLYIIAFFVHTKAICMGIENHMSKHTYYSILINRCCGEIPAQVH